MLRLFSFCLMVFLGCSPTLRGNAAGVDGGGYAGMQSQIESRITQFIAKPSSDSLKKIIILIKSFPENSVQSSWQTDKNIKLRLLLEIVGAIDLVRDPTFESKVYHRAFGTPAPEEYRVFVNPIPPANSGIIAGESPEEIKDIKLRKAYEDIIDANNKKLLNLNFQVDLYRARKDLLTKINEYVLAWYHKNEQAQYRELARNTLRLDPDVDHIVDNLDVY